MPGPTGRMAPTPSGHLHLGNALAFGAAWISARSQGGRILLRIEDIDQGRSRAEVAQGQREDLLWLGLEWDHEVTPQSKRSYSVENIPTWRCNCTRSARLSGQCRCQENPPETGSWRFQVPPDPVLFWDRAWGKQTFPPEAGPILMTATGEPTYPLAVVMDDGRDQITEVVRGADLLEATPTQIQLHRALGQTPPSWLHVPILYGEDGKKLSKSHGSTEIRALRAAGWTPERVWALLLPLVGAEPPLLRARLEFSEWEKSWIVNRNHEIGKKL